MRVLITGATGLLGQYLIATAPDSMELLGTSRSPTPPVLTRCEFAVLDLRDSQPTENLLNEYQPEVIFHCAAEGSVDAVESAPEQFRELNVHVPEALALWASSANAKFVHVSSNAVFGNVGNPHDDLDAPAPINNYGKLKAEAESRVMTANANALVIRPIFLYGWSPPGARPNPATSWVASLSSGKKLNIVEDVFTQPLFARDCAGIMWDAMKRDLNGPLNVSGGQTMSLYDFAKTLADAFGHDRELIHKSRSAEFPDLAPRPSHVEFNLRRLTDEMGISPLYPVEGLNAMRIERTAR